MSLTPVCLCLAGAELSRLPVGSKLGRGPDNIKSEEIMSQSGYNINLSTKDLRLQGQFRLLIVGSPGKMCQNFVNMRAESKDKSQLVILFYHRNRGRQIKTVCGFDFKPFYLL